MVPRQQKENEVTVPALAPPRRIIRTTAAMEYLGVTRRLLFVLVDEGRLQPIMIGSTSFFPVDQLDEVLEGTR